MVRIISLIAFVLVGQAVHPMLTIGYAQRPNQKTTGQISTAALDAFKGTEGSTLVVKQGPLLNFMSFCADADFTTANTVAFRTTCMGSSEQSLFDFMLKFDPLKKGYYFSVKTYYLNSTREFGPAVKDLPVTYVEGTGFSGKGTTNYKGQDLQVTVAISQKETQHHEWVVRFSSGDSMAFQYEFESKKKSP